MKHARLTPWPAILVPIVLLTMPDAAHACSDLGPPRLECVTDGPDVGWTTCSDHSQCPTGAVCGYGGQCTCGCDYGETCDEQGCRCAPATFEIPPGCWGVESSWGSSCGPYRSVVCWDVEDCASSRSCSEPVSCTTSCEGTCLDGAPTVCRRGVCVCGDTPAPPQRGACAVAWTGNPTASFVLGLLACLLILRRCGAARARPSAP